jgi:hypothetical protein
MARSLTVQHDEKPSTSPLFNAFLLLAFGWMALTALTGMGGEALPMDVSKIHAE